MALAGLLVATRVPATLEPDSYIAYQAADALEQFRGSAPLETLALNVDDQNLSKSELKVVLEPARFGSGNPLRDTNARRTVFETDKYPTATFTATEVVASAPTLSDGATRQLQVTGTLTLHGVEKEVTVPVSVTRSQGVLTATGNFSVRLSDYAIKQPTVLFLKVGDEVTVNFTITGKLPTSD